MQAVVKHVCQQSFDIIPIYRNFLKELYHIESRHVSNTKHFLWKASPVYTYVKALILKNGKQEDITFLNYYVTMAASRRKSEELERIYKGVGERSVEETAKIVGLKLPKLYDDSDK